MDAPQPQQVEEDGQQDDQEAAREQVVVADEGHTPPVPVASPEHLLSDVSAGMKTNRSSEKVQAGACCSWRSLPLKQGTVAQSELPANAMLFMLRQRHAEARP